MNIQKITKILTDSGIEENEAKIEVKMLFEHFCNYTEKDFILGKPLREELVELVEEKARERAITRIPIQYITGKAYFMGEYLKVTPDVLIPRDETEILVRKAIEIINRNGLPPQTNPLLEEREYTVLDIGTGSGCIACTIAKQTDATVLGVDIRPAVDKQRFHYPVMFTESKNPAFLNGAVVEFDEKLGKATKIQRIIKR